MKKFIIKHIIKIKQKREYKEIKKYEK